MEDFQVWPGASGLTPVWLQEDPMELVKDVSPMKSNPASIMSTELGKISKIFEIL